MQPTDYWPNPNFCNGTAPLGSNGLVTLANGSKVYGYTFTATYPSSCTAVTFGDNEAGSTTNTLNATGKTHFHVDVWSPVPVPLSFELVNDASGGVNCAAPESCGTYVAASIPAGQWFGVDVAIPAGFSAAPGPLTAINMLQQLIIQPSPALSGAATATFYLDNIYVY